MFQIKVDAYVAILALIKVDANVALAVLVALKANVALFVAILLQLIAKDVVALVDVLKLKLDLVAFLLVNVNLKLKANLDILVLLVLQLLKVVDLTVLANLFVGIKVAIIGPILNLCGSSGKLRDFLKICASLNIDWYNALKPYCKNIIAIYLEILGLIGVSVGI